MLSKSQFVPRSVVAESLSQPPAEGKRELEPLKTLATETGFPAKLLEDTNVSPGIPEVHRHEDDLWICVDGEVTFVVDGALTEARIHISSKTGKPNELELKGSGIEGGVEHTLKAGDMLYVPAGQPHLHRSQGTARLWIIKLPAKETVPLESVPGWKGEPTGA